MGHERRPRGIAKLTRPRTRHALARERLFALLDERSQTPVVWVSGPPGAGKTVLVASYLESRNVRHHWFQVDAADADPAVFFHYLEALAAAATPARRGGALPRYGPEYRSDLAAFACRFFRAFFECLRAGDVLVLDDCHECPGDDFAALLRAACAERPEGIGLFFCSRMPVPPALARTRASGALLEISWSHLRITAEETEQWVTGAGADPAQAVTLHCQADGWAAGLRLLIENARSGSTAAGGVDSLSRESVFHYFAGEILEREPAATQRVLMATSLFPETTAEMAAAVTGDPDAGNILAGLARRNAFTSCKEGHPPAYRYHDLFRAFLQSRLETQLEGAARDRLRVSAARVLVQCGRPEAAGEVLVQGRLWGALAELLEAVGDTMLGQGRWATLLTWLSGVDDAVLAGESGLLYWKGMATIAESARDAVPLLVQAVRQAGGGEPTPAFFRSVCGVCEAIFYRYTDFEELDGWLPLLPQRPDDFVACGTEMLEARIAVALVQIAFLRCPPSLDYRPFAQRAIVLLGQGHPAGRTVEYGSRLMVALANQGDIELAGQVAEIVGEELRLRPAPPMQHAWWQRCLGLLHNMSGDPRRASDHAGAALEAAHEHGLRAVVVTSASLQMHLQRTLGLPTEALEATFDLLEGACDARSPQMAAFRAMARLALAESRNDPEHWLAVAEECQSAGETTGSVSWALAFGLWHARALSANGRIREALELCQVTAARAGGTGFWRYEGWRGLVEARVHLVAGDPESAQAPLRGALRVIATSGAYGLASWAVADLPVLLSFALEHGIETATVREIVRRLEVPGPPDCTDWPWISKVRCLGTFGVGPGLPQAAGKKPSHRLLELLQVLVCLGPEATCEQVAEALWPDAEGDKAQTNLSTSIHRLRRLLGREEAIAQHDGRLFIDTRICWVDAWAFEHLAASLTPVEVLRETDLVRARRAFGLYTGHLLPGQAQPWSVALRERLRRRFASLASLLATTYRHRGDFGGCQAVCERWIDLEPASEPAYRQLMECLAEAGKIADARDVYQRCRRALASLSGTMPSPATVAVLASLGGPEGSSSVGERTRRNA